MHRISYSGYFNFGFNQCLPKTGQRRNTFMDIELKNAQKLEGLVYICLQRVVYIDSVLCSFLDGNIWSSNILISILYLFNSFPRPYRIPCLIPRPWMNQTVSPETSILAKTDGTKELGCSQQPGSGRAWVKKNRLGKLGETWWMWVGKSFLDDVWIIPNIMFLYSDGF